MNTFQPTVTHLLDEEWHTEIQAAINAMPETLADIVDAATMGQFDAENGEPCQPLRHYAKLHDIEAYIIAYKDTTSLWASMVQAVNDNHMGGN